MWSRYIGIVAFLIIALSGCGTKRKIGTVDNVKGPPIVVKDGYSINNLDFHTFKGRAKTKVEIGKDNQDVTLHIRVDRGKAIWISVTATVVNYEVARILITPDSVKILNKLQSEYIAKPFVYVNRYTGEGVDFGLLQDLLMANVNKKLLRTDRLTIASASDETQLVGVNGDTSFQYSLNDNERAKVFRLTKLGSEDNLEAFYSSFATIIGYDFPLNQRVSLSTNYLSVRALMNYSKVEFNEVIEMPFAIPSKYRVVN